MIGVGSGRRLDVPEQSTVCTQRQIWDCHGETNRQWRLNPDGTITSVQSGLRLDMEEAATASGSPVILWSRNGGTGRQRVYGRPGAR